ncbi:hypothetical protein SpCBS45565_g01451 [Spizellomyces sp. 'palustris']|nr:hypothetical protein SpCBS45565_g01451 [Spizellomyces sp. 'palustris']
MPTTESTLRNLSALVTGASRGIGRSIALALAGEGCRLGLVARDQHKLEEVRDECLKAGSPDAIVLPCDVTNDEETTTTIEKAKQKFGSINILVNNAGVAGAGPFYSTEWEKIRHVIDMNLMSYMRMTRFALPLMKNTGRGYIINIASVAGKQLNIVQVLTLDLALTKAPLSSKTKTERMKIEDEEGGQASTSKTRTRTPWTANEELALWTAISEALSGQWPSIAAKVKTRGPTTCNVHFKALLGREIKKLKNIEK